MIDYAQHLLKIEELTRLASDQCLHRQYNAAKETANLIATEARMLVHVCVLMDEQEKGWGKRG